MRDGRGAMYAQVIVDIVHEAVDRTFIYRIPENMTLEPGQRVEVPFGHQTKEGIVLALTSECTLEEGKVRSVSRKLEEYPAVLKDLIALAQHMAEDAHCPLAETLRLMIPAQMRGNRVRPQMQTMLQLAIPADQVEQAAAEQGRSLKRKMILLLLADGKPCTMKSIQEAVHDPREAARQLEAAGLIRVWEEESLRIPGNSLHSDRSREPDLTPEQEEVLQELIPAMDEGKGKFLLHGVTGSGKTEVFIRLVRHALETDRSAMILVPEIALTPQMVDWFRARFGSIAAVLHSRLTPGERYDEWRRIRQGKARVVIGARSAVFAPLEKPAVLIIDEEHETTYLSDRHPRYDAREIAAWRAERSGAILLLSSATPSILSFAKAQRGVYRLLEMPERVGGRPMPEVQVVDMRAELEAGNRSMFSRSLQFALNRCLHAGQQAMLLMNHRGYYSFVSCRKCGKTLHCPHCDVSLTYHIGRGDGRLHCHYCGYAQSVPDRCPECGSEKIRYFGSGTQKVEEELNRLFPDYAVGRMDLDTTGGKDGHAKILEAFRSGRTRILVGTQMIAKGLDFPQVTLVGVLAADMSLNLPDYRAREKTFQLLTQVAGRAGRGMEKGNVVIQTYRPEDPVIQLAAQQDYRAFFEMELERRRIALYPPYTVMARLLVESADADLARQYAERLYQRCEQLVTEQPGWQECRLMMNLEQPILGLLRGKVRWQVLMKLRIRPQTAEMAAAFSAMAREEAPGLDVYFEYNPSTMM